MLSAHPKTPVPLLVLCAVFAACGQGGGGGCAGGCAPLQPLPGGVFNGDKIDSAASGRLSADGFAVINAYSPQLLQQFAPGGQLVVPMPCTIKNVLLENLTIADEGALSCASESCGQLDGKCDPAVDVPKPIVINIASLHLAPIGPDQMEAAIDISLATGKIMVSSVARNSPLCLFSGLGPVKCSVDFDTGRATPNNNELKVHIRFGIDTRWDKVLTLEVADIGGAQACGTLNALPKPACFDPADMVIANEGGCNICSGANFSIIKTVLVDQIVGAMKSKLEDALKNANCRACGPGGSCPLTAAADSTCKVSDAGSPDAGTGQCIDNGTGKCVPTLYGVEGRASLGAALGGLVPQAAQIDLSIGAGGGAIANDAGLTLGFRGGAKEVATADCVKPLLHAAEPALPLPDFDANLPMPYDVAIGLSQQLLSRALFHAQQSGALCLELGHEQVAQLDSALLGTLLGSLNKLTGKDVSVPLRVVIRPVNPPTATLGEGTFEPATMKPVEPLIRLDWLGVELDLYAQLEERYVRLFTVAMDVRLPIGLSISGCSDVTPVIGDLSGVVTNVHASNSEILAEQLDALEMLVPALISFAEPALARGFGAFTVPTFNGWRVKLLAAKGVGLVSGTKNYNHVGVYAKLLPQNQVCLANAPQMLARNLGYVGPSAVQLAVQSPQLFRPEYQTRVNGGFWSGWRAANPDGTLEVDHPRLLLKTQHVIEVRARDGVIAGTPSDVVAVPIEK